MKRWDYILGRTEETIAKPQEESVAHDLLVRLGLHPVVDEGREPGEVKKNEVETDATGGSEVG